MLSWWSSSIKMIPLQSKCKITESVIPMSFDVRSYPLQRGAILKVGSVSSVGCLDAPTILQVPVTRRFAYIAMR